MPERVISAITLIVSIYACLWAVLDDQLGLAAMFACFIAIGFWTVTEVWTAPQIRSVDQIGQGDES